MPVFRLQDDDFGFPPPSLAEPNGLLAIGGDLEPHRLINAYRYGIFPWFEEAGTFFWYAPAPRCVLFPKELLVHKSMRSVFNQNKFNYTFDTAFLQVMEACGTTPRHGQDGSWITENFLEGYGRLHEMGIAHSVEVWQADELVGGLYGLSLGRIFYGESMFAKVANASKAGFITLVRALERAGYWLIDCQQHTDHLASLGARAITGDAFQDYLLRNAYERSEVGRWHLTARGELGVEAAGHPAA